MTVRPAPPYEPTREDLFRLNVEPMLDALPEETFLCVVFSDLNGLRDDFASSALGDAWRDPRLLSWKMSYYPQLKSSVRRATGWDLDAAAEALQGDAVFFATLAGPEGQSDGPRTPRFGLLVRTTGSPIAARNFLRDGIRGTLGETPTVRTEEGYLLLTASGSDVDLRDIVRRLRSEARWAAAEMERRRKGRKSSSALLLSSHRGDWLRRWEKQIQPDHPVQFFIDIPLLLEALDGSDTDVSRPAADPPTASDALEALGFSNAERFFGRMVAHQPGFELSWTLEFKGQRSGLVALLADGPWPPDDIPIGAPCGLAAFARFAPVPQALETLRQATWRLDRRDGGPMPAWDYLALQAERLLGLRSLEQELPNLLGREAALSSTPSLQADGAPQTTIAVQSPAPAALVGATTAAMERIGRRETTGFPLVQATDDGRHVTFQFGAGHVEDAAETSGTLASSAGFRKALSRLQGTRKPVAPSLQVPPVPSAPTPPPEACMVEWLDPARWPGDAFGRVLTQALETRLRDFLGDESGSALAEPAGVFMAHQEPALSIISAGATSLEGRLFSTGLGPLAPGSTIWLALVSHVASPSPDAAPVSEAGAVR